MKHTIVIQCDEPALPRIMGFLLGQLRTPDDLYSWSKDGLVTDGEGTTWGIKAEQMADNNFKMGCYNEDNYPTLRCALDDGGLYVCGDSLEGRSQAYDAYSVASTVSDCLGGNIKIVLGVEADKV